MKISNFEVLKSKPKHLIVFLIGFFVIFWSGSVYLLFESKNKKEQIATIKKSDLQPNSLQTIEITPTSTPVPPTSTPITIPTSTPTPTNIPTPSVTPTPGQMGFTIDQEAYGMVTKDIPRGECTVVFTVTPQGSTAFHLGNYAPFVGEDKASTDIYWKQSSFTINNQEPVNVELCVSPESRYCGYIYESPKTMLFDDTTGATKTFKVQNKINC